jgi:hypothetical protein
MEVRMKRQRWSVSMFWGMVVFCAAAVPENTLSVIGTCGYALGTGGYYLGSSTETGANNVLLEKTDHYLNYGQGMKLETGVMYMAMDYVYVKGCFSYTWGVPRADIVTKNNVSGVETKETFKTHLLGLKALLLPQFNALDLFDMYAGAGLGLFFTSLTSDHSSTTYTGRYTTSAALDFCGALGLDYPVGDQLTVYTELGFDMMSFTLKREVKAVDNTAVTYDKNSTDRNDLSPQKIPGSNVALAVGIKVPLIR